MRHDGEPLYPIKRMRADGVVDPEVQADERQRKRIRADGTLPQCENWWGAMCARSFDGHLATPAALARRINGATLP